MTGNSPKIPENHKNAEWKILKEIQQEERNELFRAREKSNFPKLRSSIYREVREEFRERWSDYYKAEKNGTEADRDIRANVKAQLIADQKAVLEPRRDEACAELRASRDGRYQELLGWQREDRAELGWRQELGLDNADFFAAVEARQHSGEELAAGFREAGHEATFRHEAVNVRPDDAAVHAPSHEEPAEMSDRTGVDIGGRVGAGVGAFVDSLFFDLTTLGSARPEPPSRQEREDAFREAAENTTKQHQQYERDVEDERWRDRQKTLFGE